MAPYDVTNHRRVGSSWPAAAAAAVCLLLICVPASCAIWGLKSHDPTSQAPTTLFLFAENGTAFNTVAVVRVNSQQVDVDGLAMSPQADLYAFDVTSAAGSTLIRISKTTAAGSVVGPMLAGADMRGAVFCRSGKLAVLDAKGDRLAFVDPSTGELIGSPLKLTLDGVPYDLPNYTDIAQRSDGLMLVCGGGPSGNTVYSVDTVTGALKELFTDKTPTPDGYLVCLAGIAFSRSSSLFRTLFAYDVSISDDVVSYASDAPFTRTNLFLNIVPSYNAGRGDLAAQLDPPAYSFGVTNRAAGDAAALRASYLYRFVIWGLVSNTSSSSFYLDDGSGQPVKVVSKGYSGITDGSFVRAEGVLHGSTEGPVLLCQAEDVTPVITPTSQDPRQ